MNFLKSKEIMRNIKNISLFLKRKPAFNFAENNYAMIGKLSASIIHDVLTPITSLSLSSNLIKENNIKDIQPIIENSTNQIKEFVLIMKDFISKYDVENLININHEIQKAIKLSNYKAIQNGVQIQFIEFNQIKSRVHALHIYQIIINLLSNAIDASLNSKIKKVILILKKDKDNFYIECKDFGSGFDTQYLSQIFKQQFTTKEDGQGFGLYSIGYIVKKYLKGELKVYSEKNKGSLISCKLPIRK